MPSTAEDYQSFIARKRVSHVDSGFDPPDNLINQKLFDWQKDILRWSVRKGRASEFLDTGLGKTALQLSYADAIYRHTNRDVLILAPLSVGKQTEREAVKFGINDVLACRDRSEVKPGITITNYERIHRFDTSRFHAVVLDESSVLKSVDSSTRKKITDEFSRTPYKLCCTATPAPNDQMELGSHAEFCHAMTRSEMLSMFFVHDGGETSKWRLRGHARQKFYEWMASWAVAIRKPGDVGYSNAGYDLPPLNFHEHVVDTPKQSGQLFATEAKTLGDQRTARRNTIQSRVDIIGQHVAKARGTWLIWCNLNNESKAAAESFKQYGAVEVTGSDDIDKKEEALNAFSQGQIPILVSKSEICGFGSNWQHCHQQGFLGISHSWEQFYQAIRRSYRFGQTKEVDVHIATSDAELGVLANLKRKQLESDTMNAAMVAAMGDITRCELKRMSVMDRSYNAENRMRLQQWLRSGW